MPEVIDLYDGEFGGRYRDSIVVRGHHDPIVAMQSIIDYLLGYEGGDWPENNAYWRPAQLSYGIPVPAYARWSCEYSSDDPSFRILRLYQERGRGRFLVMVSHHIRHEEIM